MAKAKKHLDLLVVDGYNVIFKSERYMARMDRSGVSDPFEQSRDLLISDVAAYAKGKYEPVVVFDAANNVSPERPYTEREGCARSSRRRGRARTL